MWTEYINRWSTSCEELFEKTFDGVRTLSRDLDGEKPEICVIKMMIVGIYESFRS